MAAHGVEDRGIPDHEPGFQHRRGDGTMQDLGDSPVLRREADVPGLGHGDQLGARHDRGQVMAAGGQSGGPGVGAKAARQINRSLHHRQGVTPCIRAPQRQEALDLRTELP